MRLGKGEFIDMRALVWNSWFITLVGTPGSETNMVLRCLQEDSKILKEMNMPDCTYYVSLKKSARKILSLEDLQDNPFTKTVKKRLLRGASTWLRILIVALFSSPAWRYKMLSLNWASWLQYLREDPQKTRARRWYLTVRSQVSTIILMRCKIVVPAGSQRGKSSITGHSKSHVEL